MAGEKVVVMSRVRIEKFNENMELEDVHESKVPTYDINNPDKGTKQDGIPKEGK